MANSALAGLDALDLAGRAGGGRGGFALRFWNGLWPKALAILLVLGVWELVTLSGYKKQIFPGAGPTLANLWDQAKTGAFWQAIGNTLETAVIGFAVAIVVGVVFGSLVSRINVLRQAVGSLITGVDYTPPLLLKAGQTMGLRRLALWRHLILPASLPVFVAGLKQGWAFGWRSLMAGELIVLVFNHPTLGEQLNNDQSLSDLQSATAIIIVIFIIGIGVDALFGAADTSIRKRWGLT